MNPSVTDFFKTHNGFFERNNTDFLLAMVYVIGTSTEALILVIGVSITYYNSELDVTYLLVAHLQHSTIIRAGDVVAVTTHLTVTSRCHNSLNYL